MFLTTGILRAGGGIFNFQTGIPSGHALLHPCQTARTIRTRIDNAEVSWVRTVSGPTCLYTQYEG